MNRKAMSFKPPVPQPARPKSKAASREPKPRPEWIEDFNDTSDRYKISQSELIRRKAERQSSNRQAAKEQLQERMKKLEQGIVDQDTRKVFQEALLSKGIDINPPIRRNLSQMIAYEKEIQMHSREQQSQEQEKNDSDVVKQLKNTQEFIKRMQKASKARDITHAIKILEPAKTSQTFYKSKTQTILTSKQDLTPLQNIQGTMTFLENLLKPREQQNQSLTLPNFSRNIHQQLQSFSKEIVGGAFHTERLHEQLHLMSMVQKKDQSPIPNRQAPAIEDDQWSNTIKRMHNLMQTKQRQLNRKNFEYTVVQNQTLNQQDKMEDDDIKFYDSQYPYQIKSKEDQVSYSPVREEEHYSSLPSLSYSRRMMTSNSKENTDTINIMSSASSRSNKKDKEDEIEFSLTLNNSELKIDTDRFFQPIHEEEYFPKSSLKQTVNFDFSKKNKVNQNLVQEQQPEQQDSQYLALPCKKVTFSNEIMSKAMSSPSEVANRKSLASVPAPQKTVLHQPNKEADKIRRLLEETKSNMSKLATNKFQVSNSVSLKKQLR